MSNIIQIPTPYLLFLGDTADWLAAKTAIGIRDWGPENCLGQLRLEACQVDLGLTDMTIDEAKKAGVKTLVVGIANRGGLINENWLETFHQAIDAGFNIASGLHQKLSDIEALRLHAEDAGVSLHDVRHSQIQCPVGNGEPRSGKRVLGVGTDCSVGKMYTTLAVHRELKARGLKTKFCATGQTGIFIDGSGVSVDAVISDFISGVIEQLSPAVDDDQWDVIEGQGSLFHPSFAGVTMGLIHGSQPDALILCHALGRDHMRGVPHYPLPGLRETMALNLQVAQRTNPQSQFVGASVNTSSLKDEAEAKAKLAEIEKETGLLATDPVRFGVVQLVDELLKI